LTTDPQQYFAENDLAESLILRLVYLSKQSAYRMSIAFAMTPQFLRYLETGIRSRVTGPRDFRQLTFKGVPRVDVRNVEIRWPQNFLDYHSRDSRGSLMLQFLEIEPGESSRIRLYFGTDGTCEFEFQSLDVQRRLGRAVKAGDHYKYYDVESGNEFDFYDPFHD